MWTGSNAACPHAHRARRPAVIVNVSFHTKRRGAVKRAEVDSGQCPGTTSSDAQRIKELEREVKELRRANDILKTASAFFAQAELDRRLKS